MNEPRTLSPRGQFQANTERLREFSTISVSEAVEAALLYTLAEMAFGGATAEELKGAKKFISIFQDLANPHETPTKLPAKSLKTYGEPSTSRPGGASSTSEHSDGGAQ